MKQKNTLAKLDLNKRNISNLTLESADAVRGGMAISGDRSECCHNFGSCYLGCENVNL